MRRLIVGLSCVALVAGPAAADETVALNGEAVPVMKAPDEVNGTYLYEKKGEPTVVLKPDGTGSFQPDMTAPIPITYWVLSDGKGNPVKQEGNGNHRFTIVVKYGPGGGGNYPAGSYDAFYYTTNVQEGCADVLGERFRCP